jgi:ubiquinone/menaquinone biosynthesis C-methylase UbiE
MQKEYFSSTERIYSALRCKQCGNIYPIIKGIPDMLARNNHENIFLKNEIKQWDDKAANYDKNRERDKSYMACINGAVEFLNPQKGDFVLDAACGTGLTIRKYYYTSIRIVALDISMESLLFLKKIIGDDSIAIDFVRGDLNSLPFCNEIFDKILCANAIQHIPRESSRQNCLRELARVVRPTGKVVVTAHNLTIPKKRAGWKKEKLNAGSHNGTIQYIYRFELEEFHSLLNSALTVDRIVGIGLPLPYKFKLSSVCILLEKILRRFKISTLLGHMLAGVCHKSEN